MHIHLILRARFGSVSAATLHSNMQPKYWFRIASTVKQYELQLKCIVWSLPRLWQKPWVKLYILHYEMIIPPFYRGSFSTLQWTCAIPWLSQWISLFLLASWDDAIHSSFSGLMPLWFQTWKQEVVFRNCSLISLTKLWLETILQVRKKQGALFL